MFDWLRRVFSSPVAPAPAPAAAAAIAPTAEVPAARRDALGISWLQRNEISVEFNRWVFAGETASGMFITPLEQRVLDALQVIVSSPQSGARLVRRMPGVIPQLLQSLRTDDFSGADLARKIANDVVLVAEVVRLASSAFYLTQQNVTSIEHAVLVIGQNGLRQLIASVAFKPMISTHSGQVTRAMGPRLWHQAEQCALANRTLAEEEGVDQFEAFLAGLVQNVGLIAALRVIEQVVDNGETVGSESFCNALVEQARSLSCSIAREWQFSPAIIEAIEQQGSKYNASTMSAMARIVSNGDYLSKVQALEAHQCLPDGAMGGLSEQALACLQMLRKADQADVLVAEQSAPE